MPARSISTATISFGLVSVPINVYSSSESKASVSFNMLHKKCNGRLKQQYICPKDGGEVVERAETVKGYEFAKDQYVVLTPEELKALDRAARTIHVAAVGDPEDGVVLRHVAHRGAFDALRVSLHAYSDSSEIDRLALALQRKL